METNTKMNCEKCEATEKLSNYWWNETANEKWILCEECGVEQEQEKCEEKEEEADEWDGDLEDTPNCYECGEDCGYSIISHQKFKNTYFCSEKCNKKYDGEESDEEDE